MFTGLGITGAHGAVKPTTLRYPDEKLTLSPRWRGALRLTRHPRPRRHPARSSRAVAEYNALIDELYSARRPAAVRRATARRTSTRAGRPTTSPRTRVAEAYELVRDRNIMPGVLGRICHHPCETACRRNYYDEPIAIRPLHRVAYERYAEVREERVKPLPRDARAERRDHRQRAERSGGRARPDAARLRGHVLREGRQARRRAATRACPRTACRATCSSRRSTTS